MAGEFWLSDGNYPFNIARTNGMAKVRDRPADGDDPQEMIARATAAIVAAEDEISEWTAERIATVAYWAMEDARREKLPEAGLVKSYKEL